MAHHSLKATTETVHFGGFSPDLKPALTVNSGDTIAVETFSGLNIYNQAPPGFVPPEFLDICQHLAAERRVGGGPHLLTGPIWVEGAEPGDVRLLEDRHDGVGHEGVGPDDRGDLLLHRLTGTVLGARSDAAVVAVDDLERTALDAAVVVDPLGVDLGGLVDHREGRALGVDRRDGHGLDRLARELLGAGAPASASAGRGLLLVLAAR